MPQLNKDDLKENIQSLTDELQEALDSENSDKLEYLISNLSYLGDDIYKYSQQLRYEHAASI